jgi:iron(III) transport system substrate-binding protein
MKKILIVAAALVCPFLLGFFVDAPNVTASPKTVWEVKWEKLVEAAKEEGKVMIYGRGDPGVRKALSNAFTGKYGIELEFLYMATGGEMGAKLKKERAAGLYLADVVLHGCSGLINILKPAGMLDPMEPVLILPEVTDRKMWRPDYFFVDKDGMIKPLVATFLRHAVRNTGLVKEGELKSYRDLLDPKWKGKMVMQDPRRPGSGTAFIGFLNGYWGREKTVEYLSRLVKQEPIITKDVRSPMEWVARGKYAIGIALRQEVIREFLELNAPIAIPKMIEGGQLGPGTGNVAIVNKRPHPNATEVFINWLFTKEGMTVWSKADARPSARTDVSTQWVHPIFLPEPGEKVLVEVEADHKMRAELMRLCKQILAPLMK